MFLTGPLETGSHFWCVVIGYEHASLVTMIFVCWQVVLDNIACELASLGLCYCLASKLLDVFILDFVWILLLPQNWEYLHKILWIVFFFLFPLAKVITLKKISFSLLSTFNLDILVGYWQRLAIFDLGQKYPKVWL